MEYLQSLEQFYLDKYTPHKVGYNISKSSSCPDVKKSNATIKKTLETKIKNNYKVSEETKKNISNALKNSIKHKISHKKMTSNRILKVYQYDLEGNFIKEFKSKVEASKELGIKLRNICEVVKQHNRSLAGFMFKNFKENKIEPFINTGCKKVRYFDENKNALGEFNSVLKCSKFLKINASTITNYIKYKKIYKNLYWFEYM